MLLYTDIIAIGCFFKLLLFSQEHIFGSKRNLTATATIFVNKQMQESSIYNAFFLPFFC